jgi:hypothetical protein
MRCAPRFGSKLREEASLSPESINKKLSAVQGVSQERLKGLEPSTFCMASRRSSQLSYSRAWSTVYLRSPQRRPAGRCGSVLSTAAGMG